MLEIRARVASKHTRTQPEPEPRGPRSDLAEPRNTDAGLARLSRTEGTAAWGHGRSRTLSHAWAPGSWRGLCSAGRGSGAWTVGGGGGEGPWGRGWGVRPACAELQRQEGRGSLLTGRQSWEAHGTAWGGGGPEGSRGGPGAAGAGDRPPARAHLADAVDAKVVAGLALVAGGAVDHGVPQLLGEVLVGGPAVQLTGVHWGPKQGSREGQVGRRSGRPVGCTLGSGGPRAGVGNLGPRPRPGGCRVPGAAGLTVVDHRHPRMQLALVKHGVKVAALDVAEGGAAGGAGL